MTEVRVSIDKSDITPLGALKGFANATSLIVAGVVHAPGMIMFLGFSGTMETASRRFVGVLRFSKGHDGDDVMCADLSSIQDILRLGETDDVLHSDDNREDYDRDDD